MNAAFRIMGIIPRIFDTALVALAVLSGFHVLGGPAALRIAIVFYALFLVPGRVLRRRFFDAPAGDVDRAGEIFALGAVFAALFACIGFIPGASYAHISIAAAAASIVLIWLPSRRRLPGVEAAARMPEAGKSISAKGPRLISKLLLAVAFAVCFFALFDRGELGLRTDALDHVSFVRRSVETGVLFPRDSFHRDGDGASLDARKGLWHPVLARWTHDADAAADRLWRLAPAFIAFFALCIFYGFAGSVAGRGFSALLAVALLLIFGAGEGAPWLMKLGFSRNIALVLFWADVHFIVRYCRLRRRSDCAAAGLVAGAGTAFHVAFALFAAAALTSILCFVILSREGRPWRASFARVAAVVAAAVAFPLALRSPEAFAAHNMIHIHRQGMLILTDALAVVDPAEIAARFGPGFFFAVGAAPFYYLLAGRFERRGPAFFLFAVPVIIVFTPFTATVMERSLGYLHYRMLDAAPVAVVLSIVLVGLLRIAVRGPARTERGGAVRAIVSSMVARIVAVFALFIFAWFPLRLAIGAFEATARANSARAEESRRSASLVRALEERLPAHSVVVSDPRTSYLVSAFTDHFVVVTLDQHGSPSDPRALERLKAVRDLMNPSVPAVESEAWLAAEQAGWVIVDEGPRLEPDFFECMPPGGGLESSAKLEACAALFTPVLGIEGFRLFRVTVEGVPPGEDQGCFVAPAGPVACDSATDREGETTGVGERLIIENSIDVGSGVVMAHAVLDRYMLRTIDTLTGYFCWRAPHEIAFGLPLELIVRLDNTALSGRFFRDWYGKQYRRFIERRNGAFLRFTKTGRLRSGSADPDMWSPGATVRQRFSIEIPHRMAPGAYELRIRVRRMPYLPVRRIADYLSNDDSMQGVPIAIVYLQ